MLRLLALLLILPLPALAEPPRVVADILPVHSLVARVMQDVGEPQLLLPPGASPHGYALRPSEAAALSGADLVFWVGAELTPWLERSIDTLAPGRAVELIDAEGTHAREMREEAVFEAQEHKHDHGHGHGGIDPHAWLDPENAGAWMAAIAEALAAADPANAAQYRQNAASGAAEMAALTTRIAERLARHSAAVFVVYHDAYLHFEERFGLHAAGALAAGDAAAPGAGRLARLRSVVAERGGLCLFTEPQVPPSALVALTEGTDLKVRTLDPLGTTHEPGPDLYPRLIDQMAATIDECLTP